MTTRASLKRAPSPTRCAPQAKACRHRVFIAQSLRSNYCGVYATAMLLSLLGRRCGRAQALRLFRVGRQGRAFAGVTYADMSAVLRHTRMFQRVRWRTLRGRGFGAVAGTLRAQFARTGGRPTLLTFAAYLPGPPRVRCRHVAVAVAADRHTIRLLDPLGRHPPPVSSPRAGNVTLRGRPGGARAATAFATAAPPRPGITVDGRRYEVDFSRVVSVLTWRLAQRPGKSGHEHVEKCSQ